MLFYVINGLNVLEMMIVYSCISPLNLEMIFKFQPNAVIVTSNENLNKQH